MVIVLYDDVLTCVSGSYYHACSNATHVACRRTRLSVIIGMKTTASNNGGRSTCQYIRVFYTCGYIEPIIIPKYP